MIRESEHDRPIKRNNTIEDLTEFTYLSILIRYSNVYLGVDLVVFKSRQ